MRHNNYELLQYIIEGKMEGKRVKGRRLRLWTGKLRNWTNLSREHLIHTAGDRWRYAMLLANLRYEKTPKEREISLLGHVESMDKGRIPRTILYSQM